MEKGIQTMLGVFELGCIFLGLIMWISSDDTIQDKHRYKIEQLKENADLAWKYSYVSELKYCIRNVKFTDSLLIEVDKMLDDSTISYDHQKQLIDIRGNLESSKTNSEIKILLKTVRNY